MPNKGDKLYRIGYPTPNQDGVLETVTFLEENIADGAFAPTWVVRRNLKPGEQPESIRRSERIRCSIGSYYITPELAWAHELAQCRESLPHLIEHRDQANHHVNQVVQYILKIEKMLADAKAAA